MIMDSKTPHKVPAISTSEDSQDARQSLALGNKKTSIRSEETTTNDKDESRDMGETHRVAHKPTMDRDSMDLSNDDKNVPCSVAAASLSLKSPPQRRVSLACILPSHRHAQSLLRAYQDHQPLATSYGSVEQVPLEHHVVLGVQRDDNAWKFRPLALVDGKHVGQ